MQIAVRAIKYPVTKRQLIEKPVTTFTASLRSVGRVNSDESVESFFRFATQHTEKIRPDRIMDTFGKTMVMHHSIDVQIFNCYKAEGINNLTAVLVGKVIAFESGTFMYSGYRLASEPALGRTFSFFGKFLLNLCKLFFFVAKETGVSYFLPVREAGKGFKANVNTYLMAIRRQSFRSNFNRETDILLAGTAASKSRSLCPTLDWPVQLDCNIAYFGNLELAVLPKRATSCNFTATFSLWKGKAIITAIALEGSDFCVLSGPDKCVTGH